MDDALLNVPLWRLTLLLNLSKDTLRFVVDTLCTSRQFAITLDLLLPAHIARLRFTSSAYSTQIRAVQVWLLTLAILLLLAS